MELYLESHEWHMAIYYWFLWQWLAMAMAWMHGIVAAVIHAECRFCPVSLCPAHRNSIAQNKLYTSITSPLQLGYKATLNVDLYWFNSSMQMQLFLVTKYTVKLTTFCPLLKKYCKEIKAIFAQLTCWTCIHFVCNNRATQIFNDKWWNADDSARRNRQGVCIDVWRSHSSHC